MHVDIDRVQLGDRGDEVLGVAAQRLLALLGRRAHGVADHAGIGELIVVHRELEVLVAAELHVGRAVGLGEAGGRRETRCRSGWSARSRLLSEKALHDGQLHP